MFCEFANEVSDLRRKILMTVTLEREANVSGDWCRQHEDAPNVRFHLQCTNAEHKRDIDLLLPA